MFSLSCTVLVNSCSRSIYAIIYGIVSLGTGSCCSWLLCSVYCVDVYIHQHNTHYTRCSIPDVDPTLIIPHHPLPLALICICIYIYIYSYLCVGVCLITVSRSIIPCNILPLSIRLYVSLSARFAGSIAR